ncbi:cell division protein FtsL [Magnetofaba australis]|uniref:Cell division protein FtsL n=1 Tax=Magnetofaba australis IT-1 TaxID=1434232 RepID=A0A1Y2K995_9PROT|nr:cell division protein FtsL [Magnetofaba australis]OSM07067.1 hypothetical protein MAIT1_00019 [Magnetofaba australis IT-1]
MNKSWLVYTALAIVLLATGVAIVTSRNGMQASHRHLREAEQTYLRLVDEEHALQVEWVYRTDLNSVERRARKLGMGPPLPEQWRVMEP